MQVLQQQFLRSSTPLYRSAIAEHLARVEYNIYRESVEARLLPGEFNRRLRKSHKSETISRFGAHAAILFFGARALPVNLR